MLEGGEERRTYLQTYAEHEEYQAKIADEMQDVCVARKAEMAHEDTHEQHEGDTQ